MKAGEKRWEALLWPPVSGPAWGRAALFPLECLSYVYGAYVRSRTRSYLEGKKERTKVPVPVIVVGNLTVGGTGKTTLAGWIAEKLLEKGHKPGVILRGYKGGGKSGPLLVSAGGGPRLEAEFAGDEAYLLSRKLRCPVLIGSDRARAANMAIEKTGCTHLILDDGYQHLSLKRDLDILVLDSKADPEKQFLLPRGPLREPVTEAARAGILVFSRALEGEVPDWQWPDRVCPETPRFAMRYRPIGIFDAQSSESLPLSGPFLAFSGIGTPAGFSGLLSEMGANVVHEESFPDHHRYSGRDLAGLCKKARQKGAERLLTTEKDAVKIDPARFSGCRLAVLRVEADFMGAEDRFIETILQRAGEKT